MMSVPVTALSAAVPFKQIVVQNSYLLLSGREARYHKRLRLEGYAWLYQCLQPIVHHYRAAEGEMFWPPPPDSASNRTGLKVTVAANASACERYPFLIEELRRRRYELAAHGSHATCSPKERASCHPVYVAPGKAGPAADPEPSVTS